MDAMLLLGYDIYYTIISRSISDFHKHMKLELKTKYSYFEPFINLDKTEEDICKTSALVGIELQRYIPVIYFLTKYFTFLKDNEYITPDQYELSSDECKSLKAKTKRIIM